jgi:hypothetical protein
MGHQSDQQYLSMVEVGIRSLGARGGLVHYKKGLVGFKGGKASSQLSDWGIIRGK